MGSGRSIGGWVSLALALSLFVPQAWAGSILLKLGSLLSNPQPYQAQVVRVTGIVSDHQLKHIKRWATNVDKCVQSFTVTDETGSIQAMYRASCSGAMDLLRNRDRVTLEASFEWAPGKSGMLHVQSVLAKVTPYP